LHLGARGKRESGPERGAVEVGVEVAGAGNFYAGDAFDLAEIVGDFLGDDARSFFEALGELEAEGRGGFTHFNFGRAIENDVHGDGVVVPDVEDQGVAKAVFKCQVHGTSTERRGEYKGARGVGSKRNRENRRGSDTPIHPPCARSCPGVHENRRVRCDSCVYACLQAIERKGDAAHCVERCDEEEIARRFLERPATRDIRNSTMKINKCQVLLYT